MKKIKSAKQQDLKGPEESICQVEFETDGRIETDECYGSCGKYGNATGYEIGSNAWMEIDVGNDPRLGE